jgi:hypothetical protein
LGELVRRDAGLSDAEIQEQWAAAAKRRLERKARVRARVKMNRKKPKKADVIDDIFGELG